MIPSPAYDLLPLPCPPSHRVRQAIKYLPYFHPAFSLFLPPISTAPEPPAVATLPQQTSTTTSTTTMPSYAVRFIFGDPYHYGANLIYESRTSAHVWRPNMFLLSARKQKKRKSSRFGVVMFTLVRRGSSKYVPKV